MRLVDKHMAAALVVLALAGGLVYAPSRSSPPERVSPVPYNPINLAGWHAVYGAPPEILPEDPKAKETVRWTYHQGNRVIWVALASYDTRRDAAADPSINHIVAERGSTGLLRSVVSISMNGAGGPPVPANQLVALRPNSHLVVIYWFQMGSKSLAGDYRFRAEMFLNRLLGIRKNLAVIRVATVREGATETPHPETAEDFLQAFYPKLMSTLVKRPPEPM
jgi:EpsI family protein